MRNKLRILMAVIILGLSLGYTFGAVWTGFVRKGNIRWLGYNEGMEKAKRENKQILLNFVTQWCDWCKRMDEDTFSNIDVQEMIEKNFVPIRVDAGLQGEVNHEGRKMGYKELTVHYNVKEVPTTWFLESNGTLIDMMPGKIEPDYFLKTLSYVKESAYKTDVRLADYATVRK